MGSELVQRRKLQRRRYVLTDEGIRISEYTLLGGKTYLVRYDTMFGDRIELRVSSQEAFWLGLCAFGGAIACLLGWAIGAKDIHWAYAPVLGILAFGFLLGFLISRADLIWFNDGTSSSFWLVRDQPSREAVDAFLDEAAIKARERARFRLLPLVRSKDEQADREHAAFLRDKGIITEAEYADYTRSRKHSGDNRLN